jgi:hypothetical protein
MAQIMLGINYKHDNDSLWPCLNVDYIDWNSEVFNYFTQSLHAKELKLAMHVSFEIVICWPLMFTKIMVASLFWEWFEIDECQVMEE